MSSAALKDRVRFYLVDCTTRTGKGIDIALITLNALTCIAYIACTYDVEDSPLTPWLTVVEWVFVVVFSVEYLLRLWVAENRLRHIFSPYAIIDLISILPAFFTMAFATKVDLRFLRVARVFRIFRFLRFLQDGEFFFGTITTMHLRFARLGFTAIAIIFTASACIYEAEKVANPLEFGTLGDAVYFTVVSVTTVGYGDQAPRTGMGRLVTALMIITGVITIPYHLGQIARQIFLDKMRRDVVCTACGLPQHERGSRFCRQCGHKLPPEEATTSPS